jgi:ABC-type bacteriocin/lantibiotic exporter with double-glycine peptidase domain
MVLLVDGYLAIQGQTTLRTAVAFVVGFDRLSGPLRDLLEFYRVYQHARVQYQMITDWAELDAGAGKMAVS